MFVVLLTAAVATPSIDHATVALIVAVLTFVGVLVASATNIIMSRNTLLVSKGNSAKLDVSHQQGNDIKIQVNGNLSEANHKLETSLLAQGRAEQKLEDAEAEITSLKAELVAAQDQKSSPTTA